MPNSGNAMLSASRGRSPDKNDRVLTTGHGAVGDPPAKQRDSQGITGLAEGVQDPRCHAGSAGCEALRWSS
jgi:hypothetical protein